MHPYTVSKDAQRPKRTAYANAHLLQLNLFRKASVIYRPNAHLVLYIKLRHYFAQATSYSPSTSAN